MQDAEKAWVGRKWEGRSHFYSQSSISGPGCILAALAMQHHCIASVWLMQHANRDAEDRDKMPGPNQISFSGPAQAWRGREGRSPANLHRRRNLLTRPYCCLLGWCPIDCSLCENWSVRIGKGGKDTVCAWVNGGGGVAGVERDFSNRHLRSPAGLRHLCVSTAIAMAPGCLDGARHGPSSSRWHLRLIKLPSLES